MRAHNIGASYSRWWYGNIISKYSGPYIALSGARAPVHRDQGGEGHPRRRSSGIGVAQLLSFVVQ